MIFLLFIFIPFIPFIPVEMIFRTGMKGIKGIKTKQAKSILTPIPTMMLQAEFAKRATAMAGPKADHRASLAHLDALFSSLQHHAFRG